MKRKAILIIETALTLPLFLMAMISLLTIINVYYFDTKIEAAICEETKKASMKSFSGEEYGVGGIEASVLEKINDSEIDRRIIKNNHFDFSETDLSDDEIAVVSVRYCIIPPFDLFSLCEINRQQSIVMHKWCGYTDGLSGSDFLDDYVYMTKNGSVYHRSRECSHIRLHIQAVKGSDIKNLRNESGEKYKKCIYCKPKLSDEHLYISTDGNKYHNTLTCSGLKRTVIRVKLSGLENVGPCSRCGY